MYCNTEPGGFRTVMQNPPAIQRPPRFNANYFSILVNIVVSTLKPAIITLNINIRNINVYNIVLWKKRNLQ